MIHSKTIYRGHLSENSWRKIGNRMGPRLARANVTLAQVLLYIFSITFVSINDSYFDIALVTSRKWSLVAIKRAIEIDIKSVIAPDDLCRTEAGNRALLFSA